MSLGFLGLRAGNCYSQLMAAGGWQVWIGVLRCLFYQDGVPTNFLQHGQGYTLG